MNDLEVFIKKTAKMYRDDDVIQERPSKKASSAFKKSDQEQRMSLFEWGSKQKSRRTPIMHRSQNKPATFSDA